MPEVELTCLYCDKKWTKYAYSEQSVKGVPCPKCGDKKIKVKPIEKKDVFGYTYKKEDRDGE